MGKSQFNVDVSYGIQEIAHKLDMMNSQEYAQFVCEGRDNAWIYAGGTHHSVFTLALTPEFIETFAEYADVEFVIIDKDTKVSQFKKELKWNEVYYMLARGL